MKKSDSMLSGVYLVTSASCPQAPTFVVVDNAMYPAAPITAAPIQSVCHPAVWEQGLPWRISFTRGLFKSEPKLATATPDQSCCHVVPVCWPHWLGFLYTSGGPPYGPLHPWGPSAAVLGTRSTSVPTLGGPPPFCASTNGPEEGTAPRPVTIVRLN